MMGESAKFDFDFLTCRQSLDEFHLTLWTGVRRKFWIDFGSVVPDQTYQGNRGQHVFDAGCKNPASGVAAVD